MQDNGIKCIEGMVNGGFKKLRQGSKKKPHRMGVALKLNHNI